MHCALWAYRTTYKTSIPTTPFRLAFGLEEVMPIEFQIPSLKIQVKENLSEKESETIRWATLCELEEHRIASLLQFELEQRRQKAFVDRHWHGNEKEFGIGKLVLVFQIRMRAVPRISKTSGISRICELTTHNIITKNTHTYTQ